MELLSKAPILSCGAKRGGGGGVVGSPTAMVPLVGTLGSWMYQAVQPPRIYGTPGGPPVTASRVRLRNGQHLAYAESGVCKEDACYNVVFSHGFTGSHLDTLRASPGTVARQMGRSLPCKRSSGHYGQGRFEPPGPTPTAMSPTTACVFHDTGN